MQVEWPADGGAQVVAYGVQSLRRDATKYQDTRKRRMERRQPDVHSNELLEKKKKRSSNPRTGTDGSMSFRLFFGGGGARRS